MFRAGWWGAAACARGQGRERCPSPPPLHPGPERQGLGVGLQGLGEAGAQGQVWSCRPQPGHFSARARRAGSWGPTWRDDGLARLRVWACGAGDRWTARALGPGSNDSKAPIAVALWLLQKAEPGVAVCCQDRHPAGLEQSWGDWMG